MKTKGLTLSLVAVCQGVTIRISKGVEKDRMVIAIIIGILVGIIGYLPFEFALSKLRTLDPTKSAGLAGLFALAIGASFVLLGGGIIACRFIAYDALIPYTVSELVVFLVAVVFCGVRRVKRGKLGGK